MGIYKRKDSPFWWMLLEPSGEKLSTKIPHGGTGPISKHAEELARDLYCIRMGKLAEARLRDPAYGAAARQQLAEIQRKHGIPTGRNE